MLSSLLPSRIILRADGNYTTGLGHVVRCQALAQALPTAIEKIFVLRDPAPALQQQLADAALVVRPIPATIPAGLPEAAWFASQVQPGDIVVLDGYHFSPAYQKILAATGAALVCLDDLITLPSWATVVLNQAGGVAPTAYAQVPLARLCLGPAYALLRPAFWQRHYGQLLASAPRLFLNMGGADPTNQTLALLPRLREQFPTYRLEVVTGAAYPYQATLQAAAGDNPLVMLHHDLAASELAKLLSICQVFVCPPSGVAYECCAAGGAVLLHPTAENQRALFDFLVQQGVALPLAEGLTLPEAQLAALATAQLPRQRTLFDGLANQRLQTLFTDLFARQRYRVHRATEADMACYFDWANDSAVRQYAIHPEPISWETHVAWFKRRLQDRATYLYLMTTATGEPVGQVRIEFDEPGQPGLIDYSVALAYRGQGLGTLLLERVIQQLRHERPALAGGSVVGQVQVENAASVRVFERLRFMRQADVTLQGKVYAVFRLNFPLDF